jgi:hypothetical protein
LDDVVREQLANPVTFQHRLGDQLGTGLVFAVLDEAFDAFGQHGSSIGS